MPYSEKRQEAKHYANRALEDTRTAKDLAKATAEQVKYRRLDTSAWWFTKKRILGCPRPPISDAEVEDYISLREEKVWTWTDFLVFSTVRM